MPIPPLILTDDEQRPARTRLPSAVAHPRPQPKVARLDGVHVLVVEDEPDARRLLKRFLEVRGARVTTASSAQEAFGAVESEPPDVILSDIGMPIQDGYELMRQIRKLPAGLGRDIPAAAVTAFARPEDRAQALLAGYQMHLAKPVDPIELLAAVASLAGRI